MMKISFDDNFDLVNCQTEKADVERFLALCKNVDAAKVISEWVTSGRATVDGDTITFNHCEPFMALLKLALFTPPCTQEPRTE